MPVRTLTKKGGVRDCLCANADKRECGKLKFGSRWGRGAVGSAPRWHRGGRGFESHRLHQLKKPQSLSLKTADCYQPLLPVFVFPLAFKHESFTLSEEHRY